MNWATLGWGYWTPYPFQPVVDKWKFLDSRRLTNVCDRWATNRTDDIQNAYFNGDGYETWENIWGIWNGIVPRDGEAIRRVAKILRYFGNLGFTNSQLWIPYIPYIMTNTENVFASQFIKNTDSLYEIIYLIVNRANFDCPNVVMQVNNSFDTSKELFIYDCYHGISIDFEYVDESSKTQISFQFNIESLDYGCILMTYNDTSSIITNIDDDLALFLSTMYNLTNNNPLSKYSDEWLYLEQKMIDPHDSNTKEFNNLPDNHSIYIPMSIYLFETSGVEIEGGEGTGVDFQFDWEMNPSRDHSQYIVINPFYIDRYPVTMYNYSNYLYPWGNDLNSNNYPTACHDCRNIPGAKNVDAYTPAADSPFGVSDLVGNIWQYTDEFEDIHTRAVLVKGSQQKQKDKKAKEKMGDEKFYFNGYYQYYEYPTLTQSPTPQIMFIFNGIDTGLCENYILKGVYGVVLNENNIANGMFDFYFYFSLFVIIIELMNLEHLKFYQYDHSVLLFF